MLHLTQYTLESSPRFWKCIMYHRHLSEVTHQSPPTSLHFNVSLIPWVSFMKALQSSYNGSHIVKPSAESSRDRSHRQKYKGLLPLRSLYRRKYSPQCSASWVVSRHCTYWEMGQIIICMADFLRKRTGMLQEWRNIVNNVFWMKGRVFVV